MNKLLFIDDDKEFLLVNKIFFIQEGYDVMAVTGGKQALRILKEFAPDCIILDVMMPDMDGFETCKEIRKFSNAPIIFLTGRGEENDKINGLLNGGDDYVVKPYSFRELSARIQVQLRRNTLINVSNPTSSTIEYPPLILDLVSHTAYYNEEPIPLSNREYELLHYLVTNPNIVLSFEDIGNKIWGSYTIADRRTITVTASRLRKKFKSYAGLSDFIQTEWSEGYKFVPK